MWRDSPVFFVFAFFGGAGHNTFVLDSVTLKLNNLLEPGCNCLSDWFFMSPGPF